MLGGHVTIRRDARSRHPLEFDSYAAWPLGLPAHLRSPQTNLPIARVASRALSAEHPPQPPENLPPMATRPLIADQVPPTHKPLAIRRFICAQTNPCPLHVLRASPKAPFWTAAGCTNSAPPLARLWCARSVGPGACLRTWPSELRRWTGGRGLVRPSQSFAMACCATVGPGRARHSASSLNWPASSRCG
jgi:hypothetical protein